MGLRELQARSSHWLEPELQLQLLAIAVICRELPHRQVCASRLRRLRRAHTQLFWGFRLRSSREGIAVPMRTKVLPEAVYAVDVDCVLFIAHEVQVALRADGWEG